MAKKPSVTTITSGYASNTQLNANFTALRNAFDNTLSLDGSTPNAMGADLDLNNNDLLNVNAIEVVSIRAGGEDVDLSGISTLAPISAEIVTLAQLQDGTVLLYGLSDLHAVKDDIVTLVPLSGSIATVAANDANITDIANDLNGSNTIGTVAGIASDVTTVASISSDITTVSSIETDVTTVAGISSSVTTVAANITGVTSFAEKYRVGANDPSTSLDEGDLFYNTTSNQLKVYNGAAWDIGVTPGSGFLVVANNLSDLNNTATARTNLGLGASNNVTFAQVDISAAGDLRLQDTTGGQYVALQAPGTVPSSFTLTLPASDGTVGQFLSTDGSANLVFADAPQAGVASFTATGTITAGDLVSLLSDGTVIKSTSPDFSTPAEIVATDYTNISVCHVTGTQKYVVAYTGASSFGTAVVVDYATGSAVVGTPVVFHSAATTLTSCVYHAGQNVVVIAYYNTTLTNVEAIAASISGTTLTFGSMVTATTAVSTYPVLTVYDSVNQAVVISYDRTTPYANVVTASGTTLTVGTEVQISTEAALFSSVFDVASGKVLFSVGSASGSINLRVGTVSGTTISFGTLFTPSTLNSSVELKYVRLGYNSDEGKTYAFGLISDSSTGSLRQGFGAVVNVSGTSVSLGNISKLVGARLYEYLGLYFGPISVGYSSKEKAFYLLGNSVVLQDANKTASFFKVKVSGENFTTEESPFLPQIFTSSAGATSAFDLDVDGSNLVLVGRNFSNGRTSITRRSLAESTSLNWVGIAKNSVTTGQTATVVMLGGTATGLSSLTPGNNYYAAGASYARAGHSKIGKALSATSMLITG